jgi:hypothetical protein
LWPWERRWLQVQWRNLTFGSRRFQCAMLLLRDLVYDTIVGGAAGSGHSVKISF